ncbi:MAG TPA: GNAT family N-acetyltransferase [Pyrinomonadaceae bacterium]|jgi:GNAT superfamily N-acetyltransferase
MNEAGIQVRIAVDDDLAFVGQDGYVASEVLRRKIAVGEVLIAESEGMAVGYLRLEFLWSSIPYIGLIRVSEGSRRQGVGRALVQFVEQQLLARGHSVLYSSSQANEPEPQAWHRTLGFKECGIIAGINRGDIGEIFFRKRLA